MPEKRPLGRKPMKLLRFRLQSCYFRQYRNGTVMSRRLPGLRRPAKTPWQRQMSELPGGGSGGIGSLVCDAWARL